MKIYICESLSKQIFRNEKVIGNSGHRVLYYNRYVGRRRVYRSLFFNKHPGMKILTFKSFIGAKNACEFINKACNDNFIPKEIINR